MAAVAPAKAADVDFRNYIDKQKIYAQKTATFKVVSKPTAEPVKCADFPLWRCHSGSASGPYLRACLHFHRNCLF